MHNSLLSGIYYKKVLNMGGWGSQIALGKTDDGLRNVGDIRIVDRAAVFSLLYPHVRLINIPILANILGANVSSTVS